VNRWPETDGQGRNIASDHGLVAPVTCPEDHGGRKAKSSRRTTINTMVGQVLKAFAGEVTWAARVGQRRQLGGQAQVPAWQAPGRI